VQIDAVRRAVPALARAYATTASKAYVLALNHSLNHELADKGVHAQAVLPGVTATDFWPIAGMTVDKLPPPMVMTADAMVDAALAGLAQGERVTIPGLHDGDRWTQFEASRQAMSPLLSRSTPAPRYLAAA
jgi:short-subunit dehydrogenase